jgi:hypothetical protein
MSLLPPEGLHNIFSYFDVIDLERCTNVNRLWYKIGNSDDLWKAIAAREYGESVADTTIHMYSNSWKDLLYDDNRQGAFRVLNINKPCHWLANGMNNCYYCCMIISLIWDRRKPSRDGAGGLYVAIDAQGEWDLRHPMSSSIKTCLPSTAVAYNLPVKWISTIEHHPRSGRFKGLLLYPVQIDQDRQNIFSGELFFSYANRFHSGDYDSIKIVEGNLNSVCWDGYITYDQMINTQESEDVEQRRWEDVFPRDRRLPSSSSTRINNFVFFRSHQR